MVKVMCIKEGNERAIFALGINIIALRQLLLLGFQRLRGAYCLGARQCQGQK